MSWRVSGLLICSENVTRHFAPSPIGRGRQMPSERSSRCPLSPRSRPASRESLESPAKFVAEGAVDLRMLIGHRQTVSASDSVERVFETFRHSDLEFLAIVDGERLLGMCLRHAIDSLLGGRYGFSLWARKPIAEHIAANETRIVVTSAITDVLREVFARNPENFYDDALLVDEDGRLLGLISTETLFKVQNALLGHISQLEKKEREIREKNEQMESELRMAMELQQAMMPKTEPHSLSKTDGNFPHFDHRYVAAGLVGGDFFHIVRLSGSAASVFICDVMGHGVSSALIPRCCARSSKAAGLMPPIPACS